MLLLKKEGYNQLASAWKKHGTIYQKFDRYNIRFPMLLKHIDIFEGKNVLEVGCNAGLAAYHITQVAKSYVGVEEQENYYLQACETKRSIENEETLFLNMSVKTYMKRIERKILECKVDAVYLSYVLYHFSDREVKMFEGVILPQIDTIVVQSRFAKRNTKGRRTHNSYGFWRPDNVEKFLNKNGFSTMKEWGPDKKFHFIIGRKGQSDIETVKEQDEMIHKALMEEGNDGTDTGSSEVYSEGESAAPKRRSTRSGQRRVAQGQSRRRTGRKADTEGKSETVLAKEPENGFERVLQPVVEESSEVEVCEDDFPEVDKDIRNRDSAETGEDSNS